MASCVSFEAISREDARVLILGTLPGAESLRRQQYYAKKENSFWRIMGELIGAAPELPYEDRLDLLRARGVALWDVCASAERVGSLDSSIRSPVANDFPSFFRAHQRIELICFNGQPAEKLFRRNAAAAVARHSPACAAVNESGAREDAVRGKTIAVARRAEDVRRLSAPRPADPKNHRRDSRPREKAIFRARQAEIFAQRLAFILASEQSPSLQLRDHLIDKVVQTAWKIREHHVKAIRALRDEPFLHLVGDRRRRADKRETAVAADSLRKLPNGQIFPRGELHDSVTRALAVVALRNFGKRPIRIEPRGVIAEHPGE